MTSDVREQRSSQIQPAEIDFGWSLGVLLRGYRNLTAEVIGDFPHGVRGYQALFTVVHRDQPNQLALASYLGIDRTVMTYLIDDLANAGLVKRTQNPADRRGRRVVATKRGHEVLDDLERRMEMAEGALLAGLKPEERQMFRSLLRRVACGVREIEPVTDACDVVEDFLSKATGH